MAVLGGTAMLWRLGFAAAWLVGSWLFGPKQQQKNEIFDPGAEEMPRWNVALRGVIIPVLFGTNRVSSQVVWQHDYRVVRKETKEDDGGGKMGGSGGGKGQAQTGSISYEYYWDLLYHLGMTPARYSLLGGWVGAEKMNNAAIASIISGNAGTIIYVNDNDSRQKEEEKIRISFQDSIFYSGSGPGLDNDSAYDGWTEIETDEGVAVRWPHTTYIGFKQLHLGQYPSVPQMSFEIGPGEASLIANSAFGDSGHANADGEYGNNSSLQGDDGNIYIVASEGFSGSPVLKIYRLDVNTESRTLVHSKTVAQLEALYTAKSGLSAAGCFLIGSLDPQERFITGGGTLSTRDFHLWKINSSGDLECTGAIRFNLFTTVKYLPYYPEYVGVSGMQTSQDPIVFFWESAGSFPSQGLRLPSVDGFELLNGASYATNIIDLNMAGMSGSGLDDSFGGLLPRGVSYRPAKRFWWMLPYLDTSGMVPVVKTRLYFYIGKSDIKWAVDNSSLNESSYVATNGVTYPNGFAGYLEFDVPEFSLTLQWTPDVTPTIDNAAFGGAIPFTDVTRVDGTADTNAYSDYRNAPCITKIRSGPNAGVYIVIFAGAAMDIGGVDQFSGQSTYNTYARYRVFAYDLTTGDFLPLYSGNFQPFLRGTDWLAATTTDFQHQDFMVHYDQGSGKLYWISQTYTWNDTYQLFGFIGDFDIGVAGDVYPPYIIYQILTNPWFGIGLTESQIDQDSYDAALAYCQVNEFKVSCQFRREESVLSIIDDVLSTYGGFLVISNGLVKFKQLEYLDGAQSSVRTIDNHHLIVDRSGDPPVKVTKAARQDTFNKVKVNYFDRTLDYAQNQVEEADEVDQDLNGIRPREFPAIFVMNEAMARKMALRALWSNLYSRDTYEFSLGWKDMDLEPGDVITLVDSYHESLQGGVTARIIEWKERERGKFDITAKQELEYILTSSTSALSITSASIINKISTIPQLIDFTMYELPTEFSLDGPKGYVSWAAREFAAGAYLWVSADGISFAPGQKAEPYQINGIFMNGLPADEGMLENVEVLIAPKSDWATTNCHYYTQTLNEVQQAGRALGTSLIWCGSEMMAYQGVTLVDTNRYRFTKLFRGWGGTNIHSHNSGDLWYKQGGGTFSFSVEEDKVDTVVYYKVQPYNLAGTAFDISSINYKTYTIRGEYFRPRPVGALEYDNNRGKTRFYVGSTVDIPISWNKASNKFGYGSKGYGKGVEGYGHFSVDSVPYTYRVEVVGSGGVTVRSLSQASETIVYTSSMNASDNGAWRGNVAFKVTPYNTYGDALNTSVISLELW